nr:PRD domain-containing protein [Vagococcus fluvialis]
MILSPREKQLLTELLNNTKEVSVSQMIGLLKVSKRTVYRELDSLIETLHSIDIEVKKVSRGNYQLMIDDIQRERLMKLVGSDSWMELSTSERQRGILYDLLETLAPIPMTNFLKIYDISNTTFYGDIKQLETRLAKSPLKIVRNMGYEIIGSEKYRRLLMANILESEINEYEFFHLQDIPEQGNFFVKFLKEEQFDLVKTIVLEELNQSLPKLSDRKLQHLVLMILIAVDRVAQGHVLIEESYMELINKETLNISKRIFSKLGRETKQLFPVNEIVFYANLLNDFSNSFEDDFFEESFDSELAYSVKRLIELVSEQTEVSFFEDYNLYKMLLTHLSGVFSRAILQEDQLRNPILERIMEQYVEVANGIKESLPLVFPNQQLTEEEIAYMVLHFANSLERSPKVMEVDIAGFSPSGLVSTSMLEMKLRNHFPFIHTIHFFSIAELGTVDLENDYDLVVSTSLLPGFTGKYQLVSPLLLEDEVKKLKEIFKEMDHLKARPVRKHHQVNDFSKPYEEVRQFMEHVNELLERFFIKTIENKTDLESLIVELITCMPDNLISDSKDIEMKLLKRVNQSPVGIPNTTMALFHGATKGVNQTIFYIVNLNNSIEMLGMDQETMNVTRILVMLSPLETSKVETKLLSKISGAIIMNDLYTEIFNSGNEPIVYQLLSSLLIDEMKV